MAGILLNTSARLEKNTYHENNITTAMNTTTGAAGSSWLLVIFVMLSLLIVLTNGLVFALFIMRKKLRTATNYLLLDLALVDFLNGALNIPYLLALMYNLLENSETIRLLNTATHSFTALASIYHILLVTGDKYFAVMKPLRRYQVTKPKVALAIASVWCISGLFSFVQFAWSMDSRYSQVIYTVLLIVFALLLPYPFMLFAFVKMFLKISRRTTELQRGEHSTNTKVIRKNNNDRKCVIVFSLMALVYATCWFPYYTMTLMLSLGYNPNRKSLLAIITIRYLTSLFNPIIYTFFKGDFKMALKSLRFSGSHNSDTREIYLKSLIGESRRSGRNELVRFVNEN